jgi:uncharacterized protein (DUF305 family)
MTRPTLVRTALAVLTATSVLAGCSGTATNDTTGGSPATSAASSQQADHNQADVTFAQQMIPHHAQAVDMAELAPAHTSNTKVLDLAGRIQKAQDPEIQTMTGWLKTWGAQAPATTGMPGMDHGPSMPGMMPQEDMTQLGQAKNAEFDRLWLTMMIRHHQGAIEMANTELSQGSNAEAKKLAEQIIDAQQTEITEMQSLLPQG